ncbi:hypothetical protein AVEN_98800-1 [Araneus ventricosus]|uniref:Uncharacterized protein n=1 Tax=Araneus ventricosus TaxID=182803 RepID=A0A4Y2VUG6_ARAVE|nr:hypothetical protein AVEN_98800-1 [Araneus ventricosus]
MSGDPEQAKRVCVESAAMVTDDETLNEKTVLTAFDQKRREDLLAQCDETKRQLDHLTGILSTYSDCLFPESCPFAEKPARSKTNDKEKFVQSPKRKQKIKSKAINENVIIPTQNNFEVLNQITVNEETNENQSQNNEKQESNKSIPPLMLKYVSNYEEILKDMINSGLITNSEMG